MLLVFASVWAEKDVKTYEIENGLFGKDSPIKFLLKGIVENGDNKELTSYLKVFNQMFPLLKAFADPLSPGATSAIKEYQWSWCWRNQEGYALFCVNFVWQFVIGWQASQYHDDNRFYNLTIVPYAKMNANANVTTEQDPVKLNVGPWVRVINFEAPVSFEMVDKDTLCYAGYAKANPITIDAGFSASFLECEITIPEDTHHCDYTEALGAKFFHLELTDPYITVLLDRTCVHSG